MPSKSFGPAGWGPEELTPATWDGGGVDIIWIPLLLSMFWFDEGPNNAMIESLLFGSLSIELLLMLVVAGAFVTVDVVVSEDGAAKKLPKDWNRLVKP